jgi:hypothetical protein
MDMQEKIAERIKSLNTRYPFTDNLNFEVIASTDVDSIATNLTSDTRELIVNKDWLDSASDNDIDWTLLFISNLIDLEFYEKQRELTNTQRTKYNTAVAYYVNGLIVDYEDPDLKIINGALYSETYKGKSVEEIAALLDMNNLIKVDNK